MRDQIIEKLASLSTAAFGLVAALAWNSAIQKLFQQLFGEQSTLTAMFLYAIFVTAIAVAITIYIGKAADKAKTLQEKLAQKAQSFRHKQKPQAQNQSN